MSNRKELKRTRRREAEAIFEREQIEALPRKAGSLVQWGDQGVIWQRAGDDEWVPLHASDGFVAQSGYGTFPSAHIATSWQGWKQIKKLPAIPKETNHDHQ